MFYKNNEKIFFKNNKNIIGNIIFLFFLLLFCFFSFLNIEEIEPKDNWWNINYNNNFLKTFIQIIFIIIIVILILDIIFYNNDIIIINRNTKNVIFTRGRWKFSKRIILPFNEIKNIILINNMEMGSESGPVYSYKIDIYDYNLNAYEIYEDKNFEEIERIAQEIAKIIDKEINDWTHIENYEGYINRII